MELHYWLFDIGLISIYPVLSSAENIIIEEETFQLSWFHFKHLKTLANTSKHLEMKHVNEIQKSKGK